MGPRSASPASGFPLPRLVIYAAVALVGVVFLSVIGELTGSGGGSAPGSGGAAAAAGSLFGVDPEAGAKDGENDAALLQEGSGFRGSAPRPSQGGAEPYSRAPARDAVQAAHVGARPAPRPSGCLSVQDFFPTKTFVAGRWFDDQVRAIQGRAEGARWIGILGKGLPDYLRSLGWREVDHPAEASLLVTRVFYHPSVPWNTVAQGYKPLAVSTFPKRSPYSLFSGCRVGVKESIYACLMDLHAIRPEARVMDWFSPSFVYMRPVTRAEANEQEQRFMEFHRKYSEGDAGDRRWFVKPGGSVVGGVGIEVFNEPADMVNHARKLLRKKHKDKYQVLGYDERPSVVIQQKIPNLFRLQGRLWDLRVFVLVTSVAPREVFWLPAESIVRKTGSGSDTDDSSGTTDRKKLLVNFSFHKNPDNVLQVQELRKELETLPRADGGSGSLWDQFTEVTVPSITHALSSVFSLPMDWTQRPRAFAALGCDFMMDASSLKAHFIECNDGPMYFGAYIPRLRPLFTERLYPKMMDLVANTGRECPNLESRTSAVRLDTSRVLTDEELLRAREERHHEDLVAAATSPN